MMKIRNYFTLHLIELLSGVKECKSTISNATKFI